MRNRVVTVFGGSGFIGRHLIRRLAEQGATIRVPTRHPERVGYLRPLGEVGQIVPLAWNARDPQAVAPLVTGATDVVSLIGVLFESASGDFEALQAELPGHIGTAARAAGAGRLVHVSAIGADPASPSAYGRTKAAGEAAITESFPGAVILRPSIVFGPEDDFFNRFARMAQVSPILPLIGGGRTRFQPVYVGDVADAIIAGLTRDDVSGRLFELGGPGVRTFRELLEYLLRVLGRRRMLLPLSFKLAKQQARIMQFLPEPPLTVDQVIMLERDNVVGDGALELADLGVPATPLESIVPGYVRVFARLGVRIPIA